MPQSSAQTQQQPHHCDQPSGRKAQKPIEKFRDGPVHVSIWENQGIKGAFRTASIELRIKDSNNQWQTSQSYGVSDLMHLEAAASEARKRIEAWLRARRGKPAANSA